MTTVTPQLMLPLVGDYAPPHRKGSSLSIVVSGLMLGMLVARLLSGIVSDVTSSWRPIYWLGFGVQMALLMSLWLLMPDYPSTNPHGINYLRMLWSVIRMLFTEPLLMQNCLLAVFISAVFTSFWTTLTFLLSQAPFGYSSLTIGLFSLIGIVAICGGPVYGRLITDRFVPWFSSLLGQLVTLVGVVVGTATGTFTVAGPVIQAIAIDIGLQTAMTANRAAIYRIDERARNRVNTAYMVSAFVGQLTGTAVGNRLFAEGGWTYSGGAGSK
jgi:predicted MFS family arabinose efflux permease